MSKQTRPLSLMLRNRLNSEDKLTMFLFEAKWEPEYGPLCTIQITGLTNERVKRPESLATKRIGKAIPSEGALPGHR